MSIENIIDYVIKTPKNTNPNVVRSLVKSEVDENTLQKAKEYTDSQRLAYSEVNNGRLYFYGDTTGKFEFPMDEIMGDPALSTMGLVKISDVTPPAGSITEVWMSTKSGTHFAQYRSFEVVNIEDGISLVFAVYEGVVQDIPLLMIVSGLHPEMNGLYVRVQYHSSIEHTAENVELFVGSIDGEVIETVYPIDPKYLPGIVLPVVELESIESFGEPTPLSDSDSAKLDAAVGSPIIASFANNMVVFSYLLDDGVHTFMAPLGIVTCLFVKEEAGWSSMTIE